MPGLLLAAKIPPRTEEAFDCVLWRGAASGGPAPKMPPSTLDVFELFALRGLATTGGAAAKRPPSTLGALLCFVCPAALAGEKPAPAGVARYALRGDGAGTARHSVA